MVVRRPVRVGIIGCGGIFSRHGSGFDDSGLARLVGVSDLSTQGISRAFDAWPSVRGYLDFREMLAELRPHIISVCTWPQARRETVLAAVESGVKGILCETPLALRMDDVDAITQAQHEFSHRGVAGSCSLPDEWATGRIHDYRV